MAIKPYIIGIAGPSCGGKTTTSLALSDALTSDRAVLFPMDNYYLNLDELIAQTKQMNIFLHGDHHFVDPNQPVGTADINFDMPTALDTKLIFEHLQILANGGEVDCPVYLFDKHRRSETETEHLVAKKFMIVEGLFTLHWEMVRNLCRTRVFITCSDEVCLNRRLGRDTVSRGRLEEAIRSQFKLTVKPMYEMYGKKTQRFANVKVNGEEPVGASVEAILKHIAKELKAPGIRTWGKQANNISK